MPPLRLKGQETEVLLIADREPLITIGNCKKFRFEADLQIISEGYLGKTTMAKDEIFNGIKGAIGFHIDSRDLFTLMRKVVDRARRKTPGVTINAKSTLNLPSGDRVRIMLPDLYFGPMPVDFPDRVQYVSFDLDYECEDFDIL